MFNVLSSPVNTFGRTAPVNPFGRGAWRGLCHSLSQPTFAPAPFFPGRDLLAAYRQLSTGWQQFGSAPRPAASVPKPQAAPKPPAPGAITKATRLEGGKSVTTHDGSTISKRGEDRVELVQGNRRYTFGAQAVNGIPVGEGGTRNLYTLKDGTRLLIEGSLTALTRVSATLFPAGVPVDFGTLNPEHVLTLREVNGRFVPTGRAA